MSSSVAVAKKIEHPCIERVEGVCGGEPKIIGTRITISLIADLHNNGVTVDEIVSKYPHINHSQVHEALSYYYENKEEIDSFINEYSVKSIKEKYQGATWLK